MRSLKQALPFILAAITLHSCASAELEKRLDEKLAQESAVKTRKDLSAKTASLTSNTPGLSPAQRDRLNTLKAQTQSKLAEINKESLRMRSLLVKDVLSPGNNTKEIEALKKRMRRLSQQRIDTIFNGVDQANDLLGRNELIRESMDLQMMEDEAY